MNQTLPSCTRCSTSFWPNGRLHSDPSTHFCDSCAPEHAGVALSSDPSADSAQHSQAKRGIEVIRSTPKSSASGSRLAIKPRQQPGVAAAPKPRPALPQTLAFNCPACLAVLNIARDLAVAGTTAPCPHCASMVIPPRIAPAAALQPVVKSNWRPER